MPSGERAEIIVRSKLLPASPGLVPPGDSPTRPMSMTELAAAERAKYAPQQKMAPPLVLEEPRAAAPPAAVRIEDQQTQLRPVPRRARRVRRLQVAIVSLALLIAGWALLSTPRPRGPRAPAGGTGSLGVRQEPPDAQLLQAKVSPVVVLSSPPGAQVYVDGERKGQTPAWLALLDPAVPHAISVEKKCYRAWQVALPPRAGPRQVAATLSPAPFACPGSHLEPTGMPAPEGLPDDAAATLTLGFLNLGSRPSAQVLIDGVDIGQTTPLLAWPLRNGPHRLRMVGKGVSKELSVEIRTGETSSTVVDLGKPLPSKKAVKPAKRRARR